MKVFISSLISGYEAYRAAARAAVRSLGQEPLMAEDFPAQANSPQVACLSAVREADLVVLLLMDRYGAAHPTSKLAPTHEEFEEAKGRKPIIAFVLEGAEREPEQADFIRQAQEWQTGLFRHAFQTPDELRDQITRAVHMWQVNGSRQDFDMASIRESAKKLVPRNDRRFSNLGNFLRIGLVGGPEQQLLRPVELESADLKKSIHQSALFSDAAIFDTEQGAKWHQSGDTLSLSQPDGATVIIGESGKIAVWLPLRQKDQGSRWGDLFIVEEDARESIGAALAYAELILSRIDPTQRLTHFALAARIDADEHIGWSTRAERAMNAQSSSIRLGTARAGEAVVIDLSRAALKFETARHAEDLVVLLRRERGA